MDQELTHNQPTDNPQESAENSNQQEPTKQIITPDILNLDYRYIKLLGEGASGLTWLAKDRKTALDVAIKELKFVEDFKLLELFEREAEVLQSIQVEGVPKFYKHISKDFTSYIIQEFIPYPSSSISWIPEKSSPKKKSSISLIKSASFCLPFRHSIFPPLSIVISNPVISFIGHRRPIPIARRG